MSELTAAQEKNFSLEVTYPNVSNKYITRRVLFTGADHPEWRARGRLTIHSPDMNTFQAELDSITFHEKVPVEDYLQCFLFLVASASREHPNLPLIFTINEDALAVIPKLSDLTMRGVDGLALDPLKVSEAMLLAGDSGYSVRIPDPSRLGRKVPNGDWNNNEPPTFNPTVKEPEHQTETTHPDNS